jgi:hypothetical protein
MQENPFKNKNKKEFGEKEQEFINDNADKPTAKKPKIAKLIYMDEELKNKFAHYAQSVDRSQNYVINQALNEWIDTKI